MAIQHDPQQGKHLFMDLPYTESAPIKSNNALQFSSESVTGGKGETEHIFTMELNFLNWFSPKRHNAIKEDLKQGFLGFKIIEGI